MVLCKIISRENDRDISRYVIAESVCAVGEPYSETMRSLVVIADGDAVVYIEPIVE